MGNNAKIISASPFRAVVQMTQQDKNDDSDSDLEREDLPHVHRSRMSPIKDDSEVLRT